MSGTNERYKMTFRDHMLLVSLLAILYVVTQTMNKVSSDQISQAERSCVGWFKSDRDVGSFDAFKSDSWRKDGRAVVEVGFNRKTSSYSTRLCIYDFETNTMSAPTNFTRGRWEK